MNEDCSLQVSYIGTGCNKSPHVVDWSKNNLVAFGSCNSVAIYDPKCGKIITTLNKHNDKVSCVKWITGSTNKLISGSDNGSVVVWTIENQGETIITSINELQGHTGSVLAVDGVTAKCSTGVYVCSSASDNSVRIWWVPKEANDSVCCEIINTGSTFALCLNMILLDEISNTVLVALGIDTPELQLYSFESNVSNAGLVGKVVGHEDWIRSIDMTIADNGDILIASSSQDMTVRITRLSTNNIENTKNSLYLKKEEIELNNKPYFLSLETVLFGHEGWVYSVHWSPTVTDNIRCLLTASFDRTVIVWKPCPNSDVWLEDARMGEFGGDNTLGYYGAKFNPDGTSILAHSFQGCFHLWKKREDKWVADYMIGGHSDAVTDISWEKKGRYLLSVSSDKTTRLHAPCLKSISFDEKPWCELSRPQIHGHALYSVTTLKNLAFASCSEEKVVRIFMPSLGVLKLMNYFCDSIFEEDIKATAPCLPSSASITALGLSNKANFENDTNESDTPEIPINDTENNLSPNEDYLVQNTLWPETMKLYGHGNDVFSAAASHDGAILATAAKATSADQAKIILWDTDNWNIITKLDGHQLTVTQMSFSPDDNYLLSVSRDRKWCLYKKQSNGSYEFHSTCQKTKANHSRIIWSCAWSHDGNYFATGSRDCKIILWDKENPVSSMTSKDGSITAVDFGPLLFDNKYLLAVGHESGLISIYSWVSDNWTLRCSVPKDLGHHLTVQRLQFRPSSEKYNSKEDNILQLASSSADHSVRIFNIKITELS